MGRAQRAAVLLAAGFVAAVWLGCIVVPGEGGGGGAGWGFGHPGGGYRESCRYLTIDGHRLKAQCRTERGKWRSTSLDLRACDRDIVNDNGHLRCAGGSTYSRIPSGSYQRSCSDIRVRRGLLLAECRDRRGRWRDASAPVDACRRFANRNSELVCE
jgi:hypothetical protein